MQFLSRITLQNRLRMDDFMTYWGVTYTQNLLHLGVQKLLHTRKSLFLKDFLAVLAVPRGIEPLFPG